MHDALALENYFQPQTQVVDTQNPFCGDERLYSHPAS